MNRNAVRYESERCPTEIGITVRQPPEYAHSFSRLLAIVRTCLWRKLDLLALLGRYGTASGSFRYLGRPEQTFFPGFL